MNLHISPRPLPFCVAALAALLVGSPARAEGNATDPLGDMMERTGLKYAPLEGVASAWKVTFDSSKSNGAIDFYVTYNNDSRKYALLFATVVDKPDAFEFSRDVLVECMKLNNDYTGIKLCVDFSHGDIDCQAEVLVSTLTPELLRMHLNSLASFADEHGAGLREMVR